MYLTPLLITTLLPIITIAAPSQVATHIISPSLSQAGDFKIPDIVEVTYVYANGTISTHVDVPKPLRKRHQTSLYTCTGINFTGQCNLMVFQDSPLINLPKNSPFYASIKAAGPEPGVICRLYAEETPEGSCTGEGFFQMTYPGYADLSRVGYPGPSFASESAKKPPTRGWDDLMKCAKCWNEELEDHKKDVKGDWDGDGEVDLVVIPISPSS